jgi:hypothetical protein
VLKVLSDGKARTLKELKGFGVSSTTLKPMREEGLVLSGPDGYRITDDGLRGLSEIEEDWPQLRDAVYDYQEYVEFDRPRPKGRMPTTVHAMLCALADGRPRRAKDLMAAGIGEKIIALAEHMPDRRSPGGDVERLAGDEGTVEAELVPGDDPHEALFHQLGPGGVPAGGRMTGDVLQDAEEPGNAGGIPGDGKAFGHHACSSASCSM